MIPCECLGGVGFLFPFLIDFSSKEFGISYVTNSAFFPLFLLGCSIDVSLMEYHRRNNDVSVFVCRMDIDGRTQKYDNFLRLIRNRLLVLDAKHDRIS